MSAGTPAEVMAEATALALESAREAGADRAKVDRLRTAHARAVRDLRRERQTARRTARQGRERERVSLIMAARERVSG